MIIRIFGIFGLIISLYLIYAYDFSKNIVCVGSGCEIVANSSYSKFLNISLPYWGFLFYLSVLTLTFIKKLENLLLFILVIGAVFSIYLTIVELFIIKAVCMWCLLSAFCSWIMVISAVLGNVKK
jgi:uncharacterized membrane protein